MSKEQAKSVTESDSQNSFGFSIRSFGSLLSASDGAVGALSGVKNIVSAYSASTRDNSSSQSQKTAKSLSTSIEKFKLQTPDSHLGLVVACSDSSVSPVTHPDLSFSWFRLNNFGDGDNCVPLSTPALSPENSWYPPCADDIGHVIRMKCEDNLDLGVSRYIDSNFIRVDRSLAEKVEEAVTKDRVVAKIIITSARLFFSRSNKDGKIKTTPPRNQKVLKRSISNGSTGSTGSNGSHDGSRARVGSADHFEVSVDVPEFETAGSIEVGSKGILICEKGIDQGGLRYFSSEKLEVRCCQPSSFVLKVPLHDPSESAGAAASSKVVQWVGTQEGELYDSLCGILAGDMGDGSDHGKGSARTVPNGHSRSQSAGSISSNSYDDHTDHQQEGINHIGKELAQPATPVHVLELVVSCRDRTIRDCLVLSLRAMTACAAHTPPLSAEDKIQLGLSRLPWRHAAYLQQTNQDSTISSGKLGENGVGTDGECVGMVEVGLREELELLKTSLEQASASQNKLQRDLEEALTAKVTAETRVTILQRELEDVRASTASEVGTEDLQEVCRHLYAKLHTAEATIAQMSAQMQTAVGMVKNESFMSSASSPEPATRYASAEDFFQHGVVFPVYEASSGEMVIPGTPDSKAGSPVVRGIAICNGATPDVTSTNSHMEGASASATVDRYLADFKHSLHDLRLAYGQEKALEPEEMQIARQRIADVQELVSSMIKDSVYFLRTAHDQNEWMTGVQQESVSTSISTLNGSGVHFTAQRKAPKPEGEIFNSLVSISNELRCVLQGVNISPTQDTAEKTNLKVRSYSDEAIGGTDSSDDGTDTAFHTDSKLARIVETIRSQVAEIRKRPQTRKPSSKTNTKHQRVVERADSEECKGQEEADEEDGDLEGDDEGFASVNLVPLAKEGVVLEEEEEGMFTQGEMDHVSHELEQALQRCEVLQQQVSELEMQKAVLQSSSGALIQDLKSQVSVLQSRSGEDRDRSVDEVQALRATIEEQDAALETFRTSYQKLQNMVTTFKEKYNTLCKETDGVKVELEESRTRTKQLEHDLKVAQHEKQMATKECEDLREHLASASEGAKASQKMQADLDKLSLRLTDERQAAQAVKQNAAKEIRDLKSHNADLSSALSKAKERIESLEGRMSLLQAETLSLSDARQQLTKQMTSYEAMRNQITQMRGQLIQADQEAQVSRTLLSEGSIENEKLRKSVADMTAEITALKKTVDKRTARVNDLKTRMDEMEVDKKATEKDRNSLRKENVRLRGSVNSLSEDRAALEKLQPLYNQQLELLATNHSRTSELETILSRANTAYRCTVIQLVNTELKLGITNARCARAMRQCDLQGMVAEDVCSLVGGLELKLRKNEETIASLNEDLNMARVAEPIAMKKLNYMVAKLSGEKNHFENKAKSLSKDLQRKLLAGTPLQRELGRVTQRLEEVENERNAYRDAMVLACDTFTIKEPEFSWFG